MLPAFSEEDAVRFWKHVSFPTDETGCWMYRGVPDGYSYRTFVKDGVSLRAHRVSSALVGREVPDDLDACHRCDNPTCVNPDHIFFADAKGNLDDMRKKGRASGGMAKWRTCRKGHPFTEENTRINHAGLAFGKRWRICRECVRESNRRCKRAKAERMRSAVVAEAAGSP